MPALRLVDHRHKQDIDIDTFRHDFDKQLTRDGGDHEIVCDVIDKLSYALNHVIVNISWDILSLKFVAVVSNCNVIFSWSYCMFCLLSPELRYTARPAFVAVYYSITYALLTYLIYC